MKLVRDPMEAQVFRITRDTTLPESARLTGQRGNAHRPPARAGARAARPGPRTAAPPRSRHRRRYHLCSAACAACAAIFGGDDLPAADAPGEAPAGGPA